MKTKITLLTLSILSFVSPIELSAILLMFVILVDTIIKLISLKKIACDEKRKYRDVFKSVFKVVKTIRGGIEKVSDTYKNIKE